MGLAVVLSILLIFGWLVEFLYAGRIAYGVKLGNYDMGGMRVNEMDDFFDGAVEEINAGVKFGLDEEVVETKMFDELGLWIKMNECKNDLWKIGKSNNILKSYFERLMALGGYEKVRCEVVIDDIGYNNWLNYLREHYNHPAVSATVEKVDGNFVVNESSDGEVIDEVKLNIDLVQRLSVFDFSPIEMIKVVDRPKISDTQAEKVKDTAEHEINSKMIWVYEDYEIVPEREDIVAMLYIDSYQDKSEKSVTLKLGYDTAKIDIFLNENAWMFEDKPQDARLEMTDEGPVIVSEGTSGKMVNRIRLAEELNDKIGKPKSIIDLPVEIMESAVSQDNLGDLGIKELIASGVSDFSYSPANRVHNIAVGAEQYNGTLIAPGEEFSFTTRLGTVDASTGYLPELVIAGNETRPEYGGGLCQVSTTMYRTALDAGFPITDRTPHRYRVSYYEPAGQDATIYIPNPDLRFINDTNHYVLIEAIMGDYTLTFNFYGTDDGRKVVVTEPDIFNITSPPAPEYIYTSSLPAGSKVQVDSAHYGADSIFYRYITYADGTTKEEEIFSRYQAWAAKYKVGEGEAPVDDPVEEIKNEENVVTDISGDPNNELGYDLEEALKGN